jgi:hypothetical protein
MSDVEKQLARGQNRLQDAWKQSDAVRSVSTHELIISTLRLLYGREPIPFQTLNFVRGTEQRTHSDVIHFSSLPARFMCGVWTALEDITISQGPLHYYPGSHKLPEFDYYDLGISEEHIFPNEPHKGDASWDNPRTVQKYKLYEAAIENLMKEQGLKREALTIKRGQSLVWASNLCHGGNPILDPATTRKSQVTHFHFEGIVPWTPMFSNARMGEYHLPSLVDIRTGQPYQRSYNHMPVELIPMEKKNRYKVRLTGGSSSGQADARNLLGKGYYEELTRLNDELEFYRNENEKLRATLNEIQQTRLWKALQPIRQLGQSLRRR